MLFNLIVGRHQEHLVTSIVSCVSLGLWTLGCLRCPLLLLFPLNTRGADPGLCLAGIRKRCPPSAVPSFELQDRNEMVMVRGLASQDGPFLLLHCMEQLVPLYLPSPLLWDSVALQHERWIWQTHGKNRVFLVWGFLLLLQWGWWLNA